MDNPLQFVSDRFKDELQVRFNVGATDGAVLLTLLDAAGRPVARRTLSEMQLADEKQLRKLVRSIRFGLAIDQGTGIGCLDTLEDTAEVAEWPRVS